MKSLLFLVALCLGVVLATEEKYTSKWDGINLDEILNSDRLLKNYFNCLMERGSCTPDGSELKRVLPDALEHECSKCTEKQKDGSDKVINHLRKNKPEWWKELQAKYDPQGVYIAKHPEYKD